MDETKVSYIDKIDKTSLPIHEKILKIYKENISNIISLKNDTPIFVDTNVLLKSYSISFEARERLLNFYKEYKNRIHITNQVQLEFTKNREEIIERFFEDITQGLPTSFNRDILNHFKAFLERNKTVLVDYKEIEKKLKKIESDLIELNEKLCSDIEIKKTENSDLLLNDSFLKVFSSCNCLSPSNDLIKKAQVDFDTLKKNINLEEFDSEIKKPGNAFPGMGDIKQKLNNPYGDFIIYNELMEFAVKNKTDIIFLTYDNTKGDWMKTNKQPHIHYIENFYLNTGQIIYILDAKRVFEETLNIKFDSLIDLSPPAITTITEITPENLRNFLMQKYPTTENVTSYSIKDLCSELEYNGYTNIEMVESEADRANDAFERYLIESNNGKNRFNMVGNLRVRLEISNKNYLRRDNLTGKIERPSKELHGRFKDML